MHDKQAILQAPLQAHEIDFRVQSITAGGGAIILAYKDARVDMNRLNKAFGVGGWQRKHEVINGNLFCSVGIWNDTMPTSTHFTLGSYGEVNNAQNFIAMLFASVEGISKCGYYTGNGSSQTITTGFSPRFVIIRRVDGSQDNWVVLDTTRGWGAGNDNYISLNRSDAQSSGDMGAPTSTGFTLTSDGWVNYNTGKYIYYAHA